MTLRVSGKNLDIGQSLRSHVGTRLDQVISKYSAEPTGGHVTIEKAGSGFRTDCTLYLDSGLTLQAEAEGQDAYSSFNKAADRIENRLRRRKDRVKERSGTHSPP
ncbi:MAG TPA: ribosome-associated translation inhibitor RaiA [Methylovirgula sp.]|nr:ribosome-associated translation inhibitor RaiA [Methylovirgula sp.]